MAGHRTGAALALVAAAASGTALNGCSDGGSASDTASRAASAAVSGAASAASSLASKGADVLASASAEAKRRLDEVKNGAEAKDDVRLGVPATDADGRTTVEVTADNKADATKSFAVQVTFKDQGGNLLDTVVVTLGDVPAGKSATAVARSTHKLSGQVQANVTRALRY
ncbi:hypothetical protein [Streptomyces sp. NPDC086787]|uniref:hypothetical protein n=1 Tax=Streptomyces sp. NPDC086787 TaxID=3365759 RepID=UPI00382CD90E